MGERLVDYIKKKGCGKYNNHNMFINNVMNKML